MVIKINGNSQASQNALNWAYQNVFTYDINAPVPNPIEWFIEVIGAYFKCKLVKNTDLDKRTTFFLEFDDDLDAIAFILKWS